jgi:hypothetical protein
MESSSRIPHEILGVIFLQADTKPEVLAAVSKEWSFAVKNAMDSLIQSYENSAALKPYVESAEQKQIAAQKAQKEKHITEKISTEPTTQDVFRNIQTIKFVFHDIMQKAQQMGYEKKEPINMQTLSA